MSKVNNLSDYKKPFKVDQRGSSFHLIDANGKTVIVNRTSEEYQTAICNALNRGVNVDVEKAAEEYARDFMINISKNYIHDPYQLQEHLKQTFIAGYSLLHSDEVKISLETKPEPVVRTPNFGEVWNETNV